MISLKIYRCVLSGKSIPRITSIASSSSNENTNLPEKLDKIRNVTNPEEAWQKRAKLAAPKLQRNEQVSPKRYWVEDWELDIEADGTYSPLKEYGTNVKKWEHYNKVVWPPNYVVPETGLPKAREVFHNVKSVHYSPKRMWFICHFIRRMMVDDAIQQLLFIENKGTILMSQLLKEAKDRARDEFHIENPSNMFVAEAFPIQDKIIKGRRHHARNMVAIRRFRYINVFVRLEEGTPPSYTGREKPLDGWDKMEKYYEYLRSRDFKYSL